MRGVLVLGPLQKDRHIRGQHNPHTEEAERAAEGHVECCKVDRQLSAKCQVYCSGGDGVQGDSGGSLPLHFVMLVVFVIVISRAIENFNSASDGWAVLLSMVQ